MDISRYSYLENGFEGVLYRSDSTDDRLIIVIQGLKMNLCLQNAMFNY